jgi:alkylation response protein AidB-like acyl-CoA dehydrogenase
MPGISSDLSFDEFYATLASPLGDAQEGRLADMRELLDAQKGQDAEGMIKQLASAGFLADTAPIGYGGRGESITFGSRFLESASEVDGSLGWLLGVQVGLHFLLPTLTSGDCAEYFNDIVHADALLAGSHNRTGVEVEPAEGGILVSGTLQYCSGAPISQWVSFNTSVPHPEEGSDHGCVIMVRTETAGVRFVLAPYIHTMRDSLTGIVILEKAFIPWRQVHWYRDLGDAGNRPKNCRYYGVWQSAFLQHAVLLGIARHALDYALERLRDDPPATSSSRSLADNLIGAAANELLQARSIYYHRARALEAAALEGTEFHQGAFPGHRAVVSSVASLTYSSVSRLVELLSGPVLVSANPLETCWRDMQIARSARGSRQSIHEPAFGEFLLST